jgi:hypothetical protein
MSFRMSIARVSAGVAVGLLAVIAATSPATAQVSAAPAKAGSAQARPSAASRILPKSENAYCVGRAYPIDCWVNEPNVTQRWTDYGSQVQFLAGDHIYLEAGGCVQTGGSGRTWKRYVNPASDNGLYHGTISIAGVGQGQLWQYVNRSYTINSRTGLWLGYEDDGYSDNGYWGHDDGTGDQCKNVGNAWVHIVIS